MTAPRRCSKDSERVRAVADKVAQATSLMEEVLQAWPDLGDNAAALIGTFCLPSILDVEDLVGKLGEMSRGLDDSAEELKDEEGPGRSGAVLTGPPEPGLHECKCQLRPGWCNC